MGRLIFSDDGSHGGAEVGRQSRQLGQSRYLGHLVVMLATTAATSVISAVWPAQPPPDCRRREPAVIAERERAAAEWPKALLPQIELAACYDKAWRFQDVEPAIAKALAILDAEMAAAPAPASVRSPGIPVAGSDVPEPRRIREAQADYPSRALIAGVTGTVIVEFLIDAKGNVREARAVKSVAELDEAAVKAVRKWKFEPARIGDKPTEVRSYASIRFGQTTELIPSDQLAMAAFYYERGLLPQTHAALGAAIARSREDRKRFDGYLPVSAGPRGGVIAPVKTKDVRPSYPQGALSSRTQGTVIIECLIDTRGLLGRANVLSKPSVLDAAALNAVLQWEFSPATRNGAPIAVAMTSTVTFSLGPRRLGD